MDRRNMRGLGVMMIVAVTIGCASQGRDDPATDGGAPARGADGPLSPSERAQLRMRSCNTVKPAKADIDRAIDDAVKRMASDDTVDPWADPTTFDLLVTAVEDQLLCETSDPGLTTAVVAGNPCYAADGSRIPGNRYCGPGCNGSNPRASDALEQTCFAHDQCYDHIEERTGLAFPRECTFSALTTACDAPFFSLCQQIKQSYSPISGTTPTNDYLVCKIGDAANFKHRDNCRDECDALGRWEYRCPGLSMCSETASGPTTWSFTVNVQVAAKGGFVTNKNGSATSFFHTNFCGFSQDLDDLEIARACGYDPSDECHLQDGGTCPRWGSVYNRVTKACLCKEEVACTFHRVGLGAP
jgi:hypothetical protein